MNSLSCEIFVGLAVPELRMRKCDIRIADLEINKQNTIDIYFQRYMDLCEYKYDDDAETTNGLTEHCFEVVCKSLEKNKLINFG